MADKKYFSVTLPSGESRIVDADKIDQKRDWLDSHNAKVSEVNSFEITLPSGASKTVGPEEYESHIDWIKNHNATVKGSWVGAQQQSAPSARPGQQVRPPEAKRDPFNPSLELEGAMYESAPKPIRESSPVSVPERREVTPQQRADTRARIALGEPVIQRPNQPATSRLPKPGKVDFTAGHVYQVTTKNGDQIPVMIHPDADGVVDNGDGTVNVVVNGAEVDGKPVISQMSKMQLQGMFDRTVNNSAREAENQRVRATTEQVRLLTDEIDAGIQEINDIASGRFRDAVGNESFAERLNRIMPMTSGGPGPMSMPATADKLNTLSQTEKDDYRALQAAQRSVRDASRIIEEANHNAQSGTFEKWLESSFAGGVARGFGQKFFDLDTWDMGVSDIQNGAALLAALDAFDRGEPLTKAQQMLLDAKAVELATNAYFGSYVGRGYKAGSVTAESIPFMIEMCINPASSIGNAATNKMARYAIQRFGKQAAKKGVHKVLRGAGRAAADLAGATIMAGTTGLPGVAGETMERMAGLNGDSVGYNEQGYSFFNGIRDGEAPVEAAAKAFGSRVIENYSEMVGEYFAPLLGGAGKAARRGMDKVHLGQVVDFIDNINGSDLAKMVGDFERHAKWNGPIGEYAEEVTGGIMNALLVGDQTLDADPETGVFNLDNNIDTFLGVGLMGGFFGAVKTFGYRTPKYRAKNQLDRATSAGKAVFRNPDDWTAFTTMFSSDANAAVRDVLSGDFSQQERQAALNYAKASMEYQGAIMADQKREASPEQKDAETSFDNGYSLSTPSEMHDAKVALDARRAALRDTFGEDDITLDELNVAEGAEGWTPEQKAVAMDYINAKATYDGMIQRVKDDIGNQTDQAYAEIDRNVNTDMNVVIPVTLADGRKGYIVRGNVSLGEDGRIDRTASDKAIIVRDAATGQNEWSTPALVVETDGLIDPLSQKEAVAAQIREEVAQAEADKIDGTMQYAEGETRQVVTQDGQLAEMTVVPNNKGMVENEDGTVNVAISAPDGSTVREELTRGQIAQAVEAADAARLAQFDAQRAERTQAEAATADEALARYASIPQGSDIKVHWETGDATYRFEGARLDEDGEVVFDAVDPENETAGLIEIPAEAVINMDELLNAQPAPTVTENESVAGAPAQEPAVPVSGSGVKQYQEAPVEATYQDIYSDPSFETPEEAAGFVSGKIKRTEAALSDAQKALDAVKPENYDTPADYKAARDAARQPVETARQTLDYWNAVRAYADSQAQPAPAAEPVLTEKAGPSSAEMQRKLNLRKAVEAKRKKGNYSAELDEIGKDGQIGSFKDFIRQTLLRGQAKLLWSDSKDGVQKGLGSHLNKGAGEMRQRIWLLRNEDGKYPEQLADELLEAYAGELGVDTDNVAGGDATFALNALLEVLREEPTASMMFEKVKEEHKSLKESLDGDDRNRQAAYDEMMREMDEEARQAGMLLYDLLDYYDLHLDEKAREYSENYDEINAIFAEDQFDQYEQQLRESEEIHGRVPGEEGIRGSLEGGDALGEDAAEAPGRDSLRDLRGEDGGGEGNTGQARAGSVSDTPLAGAEEGAASEEVGDLPDFTGENPVVQAIDEAAAQVDTNPTDAQKEAGNYRKGHVTVDGYDISIENPKGSVRSGRDASGKEWSVTMNNNYGYIRRTEGVDGDHIDVFLSDNPTEGKVFVVDQVKPDGSFDEHKVMYGFGSADEASEAYLANYSPGWTGLGTITEVSKEEFKKWIDSSHRKTKPFSEYKSVKKDGAQHGGIDLDAEAAAAVSFTTGRSAEEVAAEREEARRVPLRERIHEWERQVGVKANIIESLDGVKNGAARRAIERGETISGWFEKGTGEVYVYLPGTADVSEVDKTYLHEVVAHKGVSEMLGPERFARLMDSVWNDVMSEKDRKEWTDYVSPDMNGRSEEDIRRAAADEYVANLAENLSTEDNRSAWDKFIAKVREILRDMGFDIKREDLQDILRESYERLRKEAARKTAKAEKEPASAPSKKLKDAKIEDFGQKIGGARKDQAREKIRDSFKLTAKDLLELKDPDKILSRKQIAKYLAEGQMTQGDAVMLLSANMAVRGATGMESFKTAMMMKYREMASAWEKGEDLSFDITDADVDYVFNQYPERIQQMPDIRSRIRRDFEHHLRDYNDYKRTYEALDYPNTARQIKSAYIREGRVDGKFWVVASPNSYRGWPFATFEEAVIKMKNVYPEVVNVEKEAKKAKDSGDVKTGHLKVVKDENGYYRVKSNLIPGQIFLSKRFYTRKQAEEYLNENAEALVEKETNMSYALMGSNIGMVQREGRDYRGGKDVNEKSFMETFAPRGVEFGNWVPQAERQEYLNKTYDAIMDFCEVVGISPKAFFLGGRLAVAFGARGKGGALAHYEPMKEVINLTRMKGAGSLAHEWFHALDNQLAKQKTGNTSDMATDTKNVVREEVAQAFREFVTAMNALDYSRRSRRAGAYWGEVWERAARLFADYTYNELGGKGIVSPLLARKPDEVDEQSEDFILSVWPYATKQENAAMKPYFDRLFAAIQEEEGTGVLFRKTDASHKKAQMDIISKTNPMKDDYHVGIRSVKDIHTLSEAVESARKDARDGGWEELAAYPDVSNRTLENALRDGRITVFSSYPIANGVFVTPSRMQAKDYAGGGEVYSKTVPIDDVAWINTDEGMFAQVGKNLSDRVAEARFRKSNRTQNIFVSNAEAAVASIPMEKATPEQWEKMIAGKGGLKAGEDKWIGLTDWLHASRKKTLTKQEVADFIAAHRIEIEEKHYTDDYREAIDIYSADIAEVIGKPVGGAYYGRYRNGEGKYELSVNGPSADVDATYDMLMQKYGLADRREVDAILWGRVKDIEMPAKVNDVRKQYTTAGLQNNREIALTVPTIDPWAMTDETHFGDAGKGRAIAWIRFGDTVTSGAGDAEMSALNRELAKKYNVPPYRLNEVASDEDKARLDAAREKQNDDYRNGISGKKVLVIDEIQSNRHQAGRENGYQKPLTPEEAERLEDIRTRAFHRGLMRNQAHQAYEDARRDLDDKHYRNEISLEKYHEAINSPKIQELYENYVTLRREADDLRKEFQALHDELLPENAVPAAPFEKNWHELAFKRMLRYAAENGYDAVAWTTGDQQADRYNIGSVVNGIRAYTDPFSNETIYQIDTKSTTLAWPDIRLTVDAEGTIATCNNKEFVGKPLSDLIGKELAKRVLSLNDGETIEGDGLRIGGEGMKGFYDEILPRFVNKYAKKWGAKVEDIQLAKVAVSARTMHSVRVTPEMKASVMEGQTMFRKANRTQNGFISNAEAAVESIPMEKATPEQWEKMIAGKGGLKAGEDKWLGLTDWLHASRTKTITKDEVMDFIAENRIQIEEEHYGELELENLQAEFDEIYDGLIDGIENPDEEQQIDYDNVQTWHDFSRALMNPKERAWDELRERYHGGDDFDMAFSLDDRMRIQVDNEDAAGYFLGVRPINYTRMQYTTFGLQNKREIALWVPDIEPWHESDDIHFGDAGEGRAVAWIRFGETTTRTPATREEIETYERSMPKADQWVSYKNYRGDTVYKTDRPDMGHDYIVERGGRFTVYLNEIPLNTEATLEEAVTSLNHTKSSYAPNDLKSRKVLVIDEIQSNRHQQGREKGYFNKKESEKADEEALRPVRQAENEFYDIVKELFGDKWRDVLDGEGVYPKYLETLSAADVARVLDAQFKRSQARNAYEDQRADRVLNQETRLIPDAPFEKNWHELAMKRMLRLAAEEGYDKLAWTTGEQQADRYDLSAKVDEIKVADSYNNTFTVIGIKDNGILVEQDVTGEHGIAEMIGKDLARKAYSNLKEGQTEYLNEDGAVSFSGDNLKIGGQGMSGFYDDILPRFVNKYAKKWGVKVEDVELSDLESAGIVMHSVDITPEMKASVLEGQTMFRKANQTQNGFISNAEAAVEAIPMEKATPEQWEKMIAGKGGLKAGEDKWLSLSDWLKASDKKTLTKQEVLDYIAQNRIQIEEQGYSEGKGLEEQIDRKYPRFSSAFGIDSTYEAGEIWLKDLHKARELYERVTGENADDLFESDLDDFAMELAQDVRTDRAINGTRLNYTTRGLDNKREIALVVPTIESWNEGDEIHFGDAGNGRAVAWARFGDARDSDGKRVLFIDEIQSKRHQDAREKGYKKTDEERENALYEKFPEYKEVAEGHKRAGELERKIERETGRSLTRLLKEDFENYSSEIDEYNRLENAYHRYTNNHRQELQKYEDSLYSLIPKAPFEKNWHELAMKRMLRLAAEEGYDYVAWTTGEQQAERYNLGTVVKKVFAGIDQEGNRHLLIYPNFGGTITITHDQNGDILDIVNSNGVFDSAKNISDIVGKDIAVQALSINKPGSANGKEFKSENLRVGADGMKGFYDDILPRFMNKYGKRWGVKVQDIEFPELGYSGLVAHSVEVTPEMKASVLEGQTMFRRVPLNQSARQEAESIRAVGFLTGRLGLAPNGNRSNLSEENWALVRTPAFKRWFGDWERLHTLLNPVEAKSTSEAAEMIRPLVNQPFRNETLGITATISRNSLSKYTSEKATKKSISPRLHAIAIANVKDLFETAGFDVTHPDTKKRAEVAQTHRIGNAFYDRETGEWIPVMLTVIEYNTNDGNRIYSIEAVDLQKEKSAGQLVARASEDAEQTPIADFLSKIGTFIGSVKDSAEKVSKVVDANGEPMVLFHQTEGDITQFDPRHPGAGTSDHMTPFGIFLKPTPNDIGLRGKLQIPLFASIRNPLVFENRTDLVRWLEENVPGYKAGADQLKDIDWEYGRKNDKAWEVDEKVFLDLREQRINKEITEEEFRRRFDEYQSESQKVLDEWSEASRELAVQMKDLIGTYLRGSGYDGVHIRKDAGSFGRVVETYIALEPSQVKSAADNNGDFDPENPDTRFRKTVTPEQDAEYMESVNSGDMEKVQQIVDEAANAAGYTIMAHHGTGEKDIHVFDDSIAKNTEAPEGTFWFASNKLAADTYNYNTPDDIEEIGSGIHGLGLGSTIPVYLKMSNPLVIDAGGKSFNDLPARYEVYIDKGGEELDEYFDLYDDALKFAKDNGGSEKDITPDGVATTDDYARLAMSRGYDGLVVKNVIDIGWEQHEGKSADEYLTDDFAVFSPEQIKSADPVTYDDLGNIVPLSERFNPESNDIRFRKRTKPAPEKTGIGYKVFYQKDGKLYPPMVANPGGVDTPVGVWLDAEAAPVVGQTKTGRPQVKAGGKGTQGGSGTLAFRPGWHLGEIPYALQFGRLNPETGKKDLFPKDFVWAEVEYAADKSYQLEADANGMTEGGKYRHSYAGLKRLPEDGFYRYRTNPNPETDPWIITGSMKVNRVLSREEVDELVRKAGREPQKVEGDDTRLRKPEQKKTIPPLRRPAPAPEANAAALVRKVEGGGLRAILGDERTKEFYESVYQVATPEEVQALAEKSIQPGYDLSRAIKEYLADLAEKGFENDGTGMLRNAAFRLSLQIDSEGVIGDNVLQYILWRNGRRYSKSDQVSEAANVNMKVRLKVGEYAGESLADKAEKGTDALETEAKAARIKLAQEKKAATKKVPKTSSDLLEAVTKAMSAQREYDQATVDSITRLAKTLIDEGGIDAVSAREMGRLLSIVSRANGKTTLQRSANQLVGFMARHILKRESAALEAMTKVKASKERQPGVDVQDKLDPEGQIVVKALKAYMQSSVEAIDRRTAELQDKRDKGKLARMEADAEIAGLALARDYVEKIAGAEQEEEDLKQAVKDARFDKHMTPKTYREFVDSTDKSIRENVIERIQALRDIRARLADVISASGERALLWNQKEQERMDAIRYDANRDLEGMPAEEQGHEDTKLERFYKSPVGTIVQFIAGPLGTFDQMLRFLGRKSPDGRGYLFNRYMSAWNRSASEEWLGTQEADAILDAKVKEVFGDEVKRWSDLYRIERRIDREHEKAAGAKHTLRFWDGTKMVEKELSSGNLLYVYMVDKMVDGQMKLRRMGITEEDVDRIKRELDPRFIQLADWIQEDFLVERRLKYDETHRRMFGSSMASIDNYFPLRVLANAREREEEVGSQPEGQQMPSKFTGSIIKRRRNSLALDIVGSDAFSVTVEHIREMERWNAWAEFKRDLGTLLSYRHFRNQLENMSTVYGFGKDEKSTFASFKKVCEIAAGEYRPEGRGAIDAAVMNLVRGVSSAKVSFRVFTALKQTLSLPAFLADARVDLLAKSMFTPGRSWQWCMDNLPVFQKRWRSKQAGNEKLQDSELDWSYWRKHWMQLASRWGMSPNAFVDALTVSVGSYAVYQTRLQQYLEDGYTQEKAEEKAKQDATVSFNESQQSSEGAFMSALQSDRTVVANAISVFRNSSFGYGRRFFAGARNLGRILQPGYRQESVEFMKRQFMNDGLEEEQAQHAAERTYRRAFAHSLLDMAVFGFGVQLAWNLGPYAVYMLLGGGDDDKWWNGKKREDLTDAVMHALVGGWSEGLALGSVVSEMINMARKGESFRSYDPTLLPALSDLKRIAKTFENDKVAGSVDVVNLLVQSGFGFNPETITDVFVSLYDACNGDLGLAKESLIAAMRILQVPQSQVDQFLLDELDLTNEEYDDTRLPEIAERYARYMITRGAPVVERMYSEPLRQKLEKKYIKRFEDKAKEARKVRGSVFDQEFLSYLDDDYKQTKAELQELKEDDSVGPDEYARILDEFYASPEFREYQLADLIKKTRKDIGKIEKGSRNRTELIKRLNDYKTEFLELRRKELQGDKR